eukprot:221626_1
MIRPLTRWPLFDTRRMRMFASLVVTMAILIFKQANCFRMSQRESIELLQSSTTTSCYREFGIQNISFKVCKNNGEFPLGFSVFWNFNEISETLQILFEVTSTSRWAALGFSSSFGSTPMVGSDVVFGCSGFATSAADSDYFLGGKTTSAVVNAGNLQLTQWVQELSGSVCKVIFTRPFAPTTVNAAQQVAVNKTLRVVVARGTGAGLAYHGFSNRDWVDIDFSEGSITDSSEFNPRIIHGYLMVTGFGILIGLGIFSAHHKRLFGEHKFWETYLVLASYWTKYDWPNYCDQWFYFHSGGVRQLQRAATYENWHFSDQSRLVSANHRLLPAPRSPERRAHLRTPPVLELATLDGRPCGVHPRSHQHTLRPGGVR